MSKFRFDAIDKILHMLEDPKNIFKAIRTGKFSAFHMLCVLDAKL